MEGLEKQGAVIYVRNAISGQNMEWQHQLLHEYAKRKGYEIFRTFVDDGISGTTTDRPGINALLSFLLLHQDISPHVLIYDTHVLARNISVFCRLRTAIRNSGSSLRVMVHEIKFQ